LLRCRWSSKLVRTFCHERGRNLEERGEGREITRDNEKTHTQKEYTSRNKNTNTHTHHIIEINILTQNTPDLIRGLSEKGRRGEDAQTTKGKREKKRWAGKKRRQKRGLTN